MVRAEALLVNRQRPPHQRLSFRKPVRGLKQLGQIVEADGDTRMVLPEARLANL